MIALDKGLVREIGEIQEIREGKHGDKAIE